MLISELKKLSLSSAASRKLRCRKEAVSTSSLGSLIMEFSPALSSGTRGIPMTQGAPEASDFPGF